VNEPTHPIALQVIRRGPLSLQVCCHASATGEQIQAAANAAEFAGTTGGWFVSDTDKTGDPKRVTCAQDDTRVHVVLHC
jgi:hypothetical protein